MPVYLDIESRVDERAAAAAARKLIEQFSHVGNQISRDMGKSLSGALAAVDGSAARRQLMELQAENRRLADAEADRARVAMRSANDIVAAQYRVVEAYQKAGAESTAYYRANSALMDAQARGIKTQRDAAYAADAAAASNAKLGKSADDAGKSLTTLQKLGANPIVNAVGIGSVAALGTTFYETGKKAGDFQQQAMKLHAAAGVGAADMKTWSDGVLQLAGKVGYSTDQLMQGAFAISKYGYNAADGLKLLTAASEGANAEQADLMGVVNALTLSMHNFNATPAEANRVMSQMITAVGEGKGTLNDFAGALDAVEPMAHSLGLSLQDVWGTLAQISQSGASYDQAAQWELNAMRAMSNPQGPARDAMQQLGLNADDISQKLGQRGLAGTMQYLSDTVMQHLGEANHVNVGEMRSAAQAQANLTAMYAQMSPYARQHAQELANNAEGSRAYTMAMRAANEQDKTQMAQARKLIDTIDGFSKRFANGRQTIETVTQALTDLLGTQEAAQVALQITGDHTEQTNKKIQAIATTYTEADGSVKGFNETQDTLNAKMRDAKAAFGAAAIEVGETFVPVMIGVANVAKTVGDEMAKHPQIAHDVVTGLEAVAGAWLAIKAINIAGTILGPITGGLGTMVAEEDAAAASTVGLRGALAGMAGMVGPIAAGYALDQTVGKPTDQWINDHVPGGHAIEQNANPVGWGQWLADHMGAKQSREFFHNMFSGHAAGGALHAPGPKGTDSALFWGAEGEHVLTADDVDAAGGHAGVYAWRAALHRQYGGPVGDDGSPMSRLYQEAEALNGGNYVWGSTDCSGAVSQLVDAALGTTGRMSTATASSWLAEKGFQPGSMPGAFNIGWYNGGPGGGHMAATLPDGTHFESGGQHGGIELGGDAAGAESSEFTNHMYLPMQGLYPDGPAGSGGGMGGASPQMAAANDRLARAQEHLSVAKQHESEVDADPKSKASAREKAKDEVADAERQVAAAERGRAAAIRQGSSGGRGGNPFLPVPLAGRFGLSKGLPGLAEWAVGFMEDMVLGPLETGVMAALGGSPGGQSGGLLSMLSGGAGSGPDAAAPFTPNVPAGTFGPGSHVAGPVGGGGPPGGAAPPSTPAPAPGAPAAPNFYRHSDPRAAPSDADNLPPDVAAWAHQHGMLDANGNYSGPALAAPPGALGNPKSVAPPVKMQPDWSRLVQHHATGGPIGTDTIPAWLSPGEFVVNAHATQKALPWLQFLNAGHFSGGTPAPLAPAPAPPPAPPKAPPPPPKPPQEAMKPIGKPPVGKPIVGSIHAGSPLPGGHPQGDQTHAGLETPASNEQWFGEGQPASQGIGFSGGFLGAAEGAASQAAGMAASMGTFGAGGGAASSATQLAFQLINRTAALGAQDVGIGAEALIETFLPADSPLSNFSNTLPGKLLAGVAGVRPAAPNTAGKTAAPLTGHKSGATQGGDSHYHFHENSVNLKTDHFEKTVGEISEQAQRSQYNSAANQYQTRTR